jgi:hypothetical protein
MDVSADDVGPTESRRPPLSIVEHTGATIMTTPIEPASGERAERRRIGGLIIGSAVLSAVGVGALAFTATNAAFSGTTDASTGTFSAATVTLTDDEFGGTSFEAADMIPGDSATGCIQVSYTGSTLDLAGLRLYGTSGGDLADNLDLTVTHRGADSTCAVAGGTNAVFSGALDALGTDYAGGASGFTPTAANQTVAYDFTITLQSSTLDEAQSDTATAGFTWEVQTN